MIPCYNYIKPKEARHMTIDEAIRERHTVKIFKKKPIPTDIAKQLNDRIKALNEGLDVYMSLVLNDSSALNAAVRIAMTKNINNYIVLSGKNESDLEEKLGICRSGRL